NKRIIVTKSRAYCARFLFLLLYCPTSAHNRRRQNPVLNSAPRPWRLQSSYELEAAMEQKSMGDTGFGLTRTGRASGCSCCSLTMLALVALPVIAVALFLLG